MKAWKVKIIMIFFFLSKWSAIKLQLNFFRSQFYFCKHIVPVCCYGEKLGWTEEMRSKKKVNFSQIFFIRFSVIFIFRAPHPLLCCCCYGSRYRKRAHSRVKKIWQNKKSSSWYFRKKYDHAFSKEILKNKWPSVNGDLIW